MSVDWGISIFASREELDGKSLIQTWENSLVRCQEHQIDYQPIFHRKSISILNQLLQEILQPVV